MINFIFMVNLFLQIQNLANSSLHFIKCSWNTLISYHRTSQVGIIHTHSLSGGEPSTCKYDIKSSNHEKSGNAGYWKCILKLKDQQHKTILYMYRLLYQNLMGIKKLKIYKRYTKRKRNPSKLVIRSQENKEKGKRPTKLI